MIKIYHLSKSFPAKGNVFDELGLRIGHGEFVLLCGDSGSGKSCLLRMIAGFMRPDSGQLIVAGRDMSEIAERELLLLRREVHLVPQEVTLLENRTVEENISFVLRVRDESRSKMKTSAKRWLDTFGLSGMGKARPGDLSRGEQVRVMLARALAGDPKLLLVDEPAANLDEENTRLVMRVLNEAHGKGVTVVLTAKDPGLMTGGSPRLVLLKDGRAVDMY